MYASIVSGVDAAAFTRATVQPFADEVPHVPLRKIVQRSEHRVAESFVEAERLKVERIEKRMVTPPCDRLVFRQRHQLRTPTLAAALIGHPQFLHVQPTPHRRAIKPPVTTPASSRSTIVSER